MNRELSEAEAFRRALNRATIITICWLIVKFITWGMEPIERPYDAKR